LQSVKQRFELIGNDPTFNRAIEALQVAPTDISVLVTGESGVGKKVSRALFIAILPQACKIYGGQLWSNPKRNY
jgi:DNA-binding NtrC family response regulator